MGNLNKTALTISLDSPLDRLPDFKGKVLRGAIRAGFQTCHMLPKHVSPGRTLSRSNLAITTNLDMDPSAMVGMRHGL